MSALRPLRVLNQAIEAVPAVKYAFGVAGIAAAIAIIRVLVADIRLAFFGIILMLFLMTLLFVFAKLITIATKDIKLVLLILVWFCLVAFITSGASMFTSVFFKWPVDLQYWIAKPRDEQRSNVTGSDSIRLNEDVPKDFELTGQVRERDQPLPNVTILEIQSGHSTESDSRGIFRIKITAGSGLVRIRATKVGYGVWEDYVERKSGLIIPLRRR